MREHPPIFFAVTTCILIHDHEGNIMINNTSPLESLAAFAICFAVGVLTTAGLGAYIGKLKRDAENRIVS